MGSFKPRTCVMCGCRRVWAVGRASGVTRSWGWPRGKAAARGGLWRLLEPPAHLQAVVAGSRRHELPSPGTTPRGADLGLWGRPPWTHLSWSQEQVTSTFRLYFLSPKMGLILPVPRGCVTERAPEQTKPAWLPARHIWCWLLSLLLCPWKGTQDGT